MPIHEKRENDAPLKCCTVYTVFYTSYNCRGLLCGECVDKLELHFVSTCYCAFPINTVILYYFLSFFHLNVTTGPLLGYIIFCPIHVFATADNFYMIQSITSYLYTTPFFIYLS